ncbi:hypothetical protein [Herminiimonas sp. CN]|uniref:hypothetical protein n=1 Tax=Herminiimonas sp. CN TaxID=1349818 RepID=UPI0004739297|nr:hypothetical protein [Herminiimonas sp. CN]
MPANTAQTKRFLGLNNVSDPLRLKFGWLQKADNLDITDTGALVRRAGYIKKIDALLGYAYATVDYSRLYMMDGDALAQVNADLSRTVLRAGLTRRVMHWTELNDQVFFANGIDSGIIRKDGTVLDWAWPEPDMATLSATTGMLPAGTYQVACTFLLPDGRETGAADATAIYLDGTQALQINGIPQVAGLETQVYLAPADSAVFQLIGATAQSSLTWDESPDQLGVDLTTQFLDPLPQGVTYITAWRGQIYAAQYLPESDSTVLWVSEPLGFHLFNLNSGFILVPGRVALLAPHPDGLIVGTAVRIYAYDGDSLKQLADYGAVPGWGWARDDDAQILFWSSRGLCSALPLSNITLRQISVDCGVSAGAAIIRSNGAKKYVVALQKGGDNFNQRGTP